MSPLIISTAMLSEPILGSILGYYLGLQPLPGLYTRVGVHLKTLRNLHFQHGGGALLIGLVLVVVGENKVSSNVQNQKTCETPTRSDGYGSFKDVRTYSE